MCLWTVQDHRHATEDSLSLSLFLAPVPPCLSTARLGRPGIKRVLSGGPVWLFFNVPHERRVCVKKKLYGAESSVAKCSAGGVGAKTTVARKK